MQDFKQQSFGGGLSPLKEALFQLLGKKIGKHTRKDITRQGGRRAVERNK